MKRSRRWALGFSIWVYQASSTAYGTRQALPTLTDLNGGLGRGASGHTAWQSAILKAQSYPGLLAHSLPSRLHQPKIQALVEEGRIGQWRKPAKKLQKTPEVEDPLL